ncbi:hypothetical protein [Streptomyces sp. NPDC047097]|uniref:hypothetical protein n=1 Tax=Streptomyces sp. NPDC047097 TaxID=3155260 RepID=UPI00340A4685
MAESSRPFDGSPIATQEQWSRLARRWGLDGVHAEDASQPTLKVTGSGATTVSLAAGEAFVNGFYYRNDATRTVNVAPNLGAVARVDMVILRCSMGAKSVTAQYKTGGTQPPTLAADEAGIYEIPLAQCTVAAGSSIVTAANVQDKRWFTDRGAVPSVPSARRPSIRSQLLVEGTDLYIGDGTTWRWLASAGVADTDYTPAWTSGPSAIVTWGSGAINVGRYQVDGRRVEFTIHLVPSVNPGNSALPLMVSLPPGLPAAANMRHLVRWMYTSSGSQGSGLGVGVIDPEISTGKITSLRYALPNGSSGSSTHTLTNSIPWDIGPQSILTIDGSYWLA